MEFGPEEPSQLSEQIIHAIIKVDFFFFSFLFFEVILYYFLVKLECSSAHGQFIHEHWERQMSHKVW